MAEVPRTTEAIIARLERAAKAGQPGLIKTESFGAVFVADSLEEELGTIGIIDSVVPKAANEKNPRKASNSTTPRPIS